MHLPIFLNIWRSFSLQRNCIFTISICIEMETEFRSNSRSRRYISSRSQRDNFISLQRISERFIDTISRYFKGARSSSKISSTLSFVCRNVFPDIFQFSTRFFFATKSRLLTCSEMEIAFQSNSPRRLGRGAKSKDKFYKNRPNAVSAPSRRTGNP